MYAGAVHSHDDDDPPPVSKVTSPMPKNARRSGSKRHSDTDAVDSDVSYYQWAERSMQTASHVRVVTPNHPGPIRRFLKRPAGKT